jgi:glutathione peroxidase
MSSTFYDLDVKALNGDPGDLARFRGSVSLVVNVASQCGLTPQYAGLEALHRELHARGFNVLAFPSNDFGGQEPGTADEIAAFCRRGYDVTFPMFEKVVTKAGAAQSPVYTFLGGTGHLPRWNFAKYLVGRDGRVVQFFDSRVTPDDPQLRTAIEEAVAG